MTLVDLKLALPDNLAREAEKQGLLTPEAMEALLRAELRRRNVDELFSALDRLDQAKFSPLTEQEVQAEIDAVRRERKAGRADRR